MKLWGNRTGTTDRERRLFSKKRRQGIFIENNSEKNSFRVHTKSIIISSIPESCLRFVQGGGCRGETRARRISSILDENVNNSGILLYFWFGPAIILAIRGRRDFFRDKKWKKAFFTTIFENSRFQKNVKAKSNLCFFR